MQACFDLAMDSYGGLTSADTVGDSKGDLLEISDADWEKANQMIMPVIRMAVGHLSCRRRAAAQS